MKQVRSIRLISAGLAVAFGLGVTLAGNPAQATNTWPPVECPAGSSPTYDRWNADPDTCTVVQKQQPQVTLSSAAQPTFATFRVTTTHYPIRNELLQPVKVVLTADVLDGSGNPLPGPVAKITAWKLLSSVGAGVTGSCALTTPSSTVTCTISQLNAAAPQDSATFEVTVQTPTGGATLRLTASTNYGEPDENVTEYEPPRAGTIALLAPDPSRAASYVPLGGTLATVPSSCTSTIPGVLGCAATPTDPWTTTIFVINGADFAQITQAKDAPTCPRAGNVLDCRSSEITVPNYANGLVIFLRRDASTINGGNIKHAVVYYTGTPTPGIVYPLRVPACTDTTYGTLPKKGLPCLNYKATADRPFVTRQYKKKSTPKNGSREVERDEEDEDTKKTPVPPGFERDWEFVIYAVDNGRYEQ